MKTRLEADEVAAQLERCDKENKMLKDEMNKEIEAVLSPSVLSSLPGPFSCLIWLTRAIDFSPTPTPPNFSLFVVPSLALSLYCLSSSISPLWFEKKI